MPAGLSDRSRSINARHFLGDSVKKTLLMSAIFLLMVSMVGAQETQKTPRRFTSMKEATGQGNPPRGHERSEGFDNEAFMKIGTSDGQRFVGGTPRVVIFRANTDATGVKICNTAGPANSHVVQLFSEEFTPLMANPSYLEIIWSGQLNVSTGGQYQSALLECTVTQAGVSVPCAGTEGIPALAQALSTDGYTAWTTYHGYVEIDPNIETTVDIRLHAFSFIGGTSNACGDTLTLKY